MSCSESVNKVVEVYVESLKESSADKVKEAFHPNAKVVGHLHGDFLEMSTEDFAGFVAAQEPADVEYEILSTDVEGTTAAVKVRDKYLGITFSSPRSTWRPLIPNFLNRYRLGTANTDPNYNIVLIEEDSFIVHSEDFLKTEVNWFTD